MDRYSAYQSLAEFTLAANNSPYYQQLQSALNSINTYHPQQITWETIDKGLESCKSLAHSRISLDSSFPEKRKEVEKAAYTAYLWSVEVWVYKPF